MTALYAHYHLNRRRNVYAKDHCEWALDVKVDDGSLWTLTTWEGRKPPKDAEVENALTIMRRAIEIYRRHVPPPPAVEVVNT
jgi:hypothetical protein